MRFYGNECKHYTTENTTDVTRVSFDFRVIPANLFTNVTQQHIARSLKSFPLCGQKRKVDHDNDDVVNEEVQEHPEKERDLVRLWCGGKPRGAKPLLEGEYYHRMTLHD